MTIKKINLYAFKDNLKTITLNQYEHTVCQLCFELFCGDEPLDLSAFDEIRFYAQKPDGTVIGKTCAVEKTQAQLAVPLQLTTVAGNAKCTVECSNSYGNIRFGGLSINIIPSQDSYKAIESSDEYTLLESTIAEAKRIIAEGVVTDKQLENALKNHFDKNPLPLLTETDKRSIARIVIESFGGNPVFGYVDENNNIIVSGKLASGSYNVKYEMEDGSTVDIGELVFSDNILYSVTNNLTNCTNSNTTTQAIEGSNYNATISANSGYELSGVTVTMGGNPVTVSGGNINITNVTGDIVITAVAEESDITPAYTNLADPTSEEWMDGYRISSSGVIEPTKGVTLMNTIPCVKDDTIRVKGVTTVVVAMFDENGTIMGRSTINATNSQFSSIVVEGDYNQFTIAYSSCKSIRFYGTLSTTAENVIITRNQAIDKR